MNDGIPEAYTVIRYGTIAEISALIVGAGSVIIVKKDIKSAFRIVLVATCNRWLLGFEWDGLYYREKCLPFSVATAPYILYIFAKAFEWILRHYLSWELMSHYLDDL